jgi:hypothetical protein
MLFNLLNLVWYWVSPLPGSLTWLLLIAAALAAAQLWRSVGQEWVWAGMIVVGFGMLDRTLLAALPRLGLSFGPPTFPFVLSIFTRFGLAVILAGMLRWVRRRNPLSSAAGQTRLALGLLLAFNLGGLGLEWYAFCFEPFNLQTTRLALPGPALLPDRPLRIAHLTDLHVEQITRREQDMLQRVEALAPDLIVLTGDYLNGSYLYDAQARRETRQLLARLHAPYGVYATSGNLDTPEIMADLFAGLDIVALDDAVRRLALPGGDLYLVGISNDFRPAADRSLQARLAGIPTEAYTLLLYHTPDLIATAAAGGVDLYLAGHTHGGQIRLPLYGAIVTFSEYGKRYEAGRYTFGSTSLYVNRGLGMEGWIFPRVRFWCPPEVVQIELGNLAP